MEAAGLLLDSSLLFHYCIYFTRFLLPILSVWILFRCIRSILRERCEPEIWAYLDHPTGSSFPVGHWECIVGRSRACDIVINSPTISRNHAALIRSGSGRWSIYDLGSKGGIYVNGGLVGDDGAALEDGDIMDLADVKLRFRALDNDQLSALSSRRTAPGRYVHPGATFLILTLFQILLLLQHVATADSALIRPIAMAFLSLIVAMWCYYLMMRSIRRTGFEIETLAFFLCSLGVSVAATSIPEEMIKQIVLMLVGILCFFMLGWWLRSLSRTKAMRTPIAVISLALLAANLVLSEAVFGAKNWLTIGGFSLQPSEFVKIAYVYVGAATLDRLFRNRNLFGFIAFSAVCVGALALMGDFGTALVFFTTFLVISYLRSGNLATAFLAVAAAALACLLVLSVKPTVAQRFTTWGHIWEDVNGTGFQQTRALAAAASGGLFGLGAGNGFLHTIFAANTDLVFCMLCEEYGLIVAICAVLSVVVMAFFTVRTAAQGRSSFYVIAACAAATMMTVQLALNVFGAVDILPFTGVTFPFVSVGGSSLISCWALLAFIKASDTRLNASFVVKTAGGRRVRDRYDEEDYEDDYDGDYEDDDYEDDDYDTYSPE
ncbi:MAG: FtsW/RodA/SpoVE family cell cycle protein [Oscillospiraceae bacterium]|jgi:cell division protein FtsW